ncbi:unnamed protein product [Prunus armeniaca]
MMLKVGGGERDEGEDGVGDEGGVGGCDSGGGGMAVVEVDVVVVVVVVEDEEDVVVVVSVFITRSQVWGGIENVTRNRDGMNGRLETLDPLSPPLGLGLSLSSVESTW